MISVKEAQGEVINNVPLLTRAMLVKIRKAAGYILAEDIRSPVDLPPFDQSAVDGYAVKLSSPSVNSYQVINEIQAGEFKSLCLNKSDSVRIYTGGVVPEEAECIIMQEDIISHDNTITIKNSIPEKGDNIRYKGSQIQKGEIAIKKGTRLNAASVGFLSAMGIKKVRVTDSPKVSLIATGNELIPPGKQLMPGKIFESNTYMLYAALQGMKVSVHNIQYAKDSEPEIKAAISKVVDNSDIVLLTGGVSVGKYDLVKPILEEKGTRTIFYRVAQKPGKPLYFGKLGNTLLFGLPGNPAAVLTCFYEYIYPAIRKMQGYESVFLPVVKLPLEQEFFKRNRLSNFLKGKTADGCVKILEGQESFVLRSYAESDCLIYIPEDTEMVSKGESVEVHILPEY